MIESGKLMNLEDGQVLYNDLRKRDVDRESVLSYKQAVPGEAVEVYDAVAEAVKSMQIEIAPVQDLHGYDKPWVGGAGKNLCPMLKAEGTNHEVTSKNNDDGSFSFTGTASSSGGRTSDYMKTPSFVLPAGTYIVSLVTESSSPIQPIVQNDAGTSTYFTQLNTPFTLNEATTVSVGFNHTQNVTYDGKPQYVQLESGSTATAWEPYSNICPISGFTEENVVVNLLDYRKIYSEGKHLQNNILTYEMPVNNGTYTLSTNVPTASGNAGVFVSESGTSASTVANGASNGNPRTITVSTGKIWVHVRTDGNGVKPTEKDFANGTYWICLREGTTAPIYTITFPSGQTVYGGTLTVNADGTGTLVVDRQFFDLTGKTFSTTSTVGRFVLSTSANDMPRTAGQGKYVISSHFPSVSEMSSTGVRCYINTGVQILFQTGDASIDTVEKFNTWLTAQSNAGTPVTCCYEMETPVHYTLSAPQIRTILGYNRIYASTGSILSMLYPAERYQTAEQVDKERIHAVVDEPSAVMSITDGADNVPMGMQIAIEPVQDKHGLEPYPPGGGKNLLSSDIPLTTVSGVTFTPNKDEFGNVKSITANGTATAKITLALPYSATKANQTYVLSGCPANGSEDTFYMYAINMSWGNMQKDYGNGTSFTYSSDSSRPYICIANGYTANNLVFYPMIRISSDTDPTYAPYSNICPITGWTGAEISRTGKNLYDEGKATFGYIINAEGIITETSGFKYSDLIRVKENEQYTISITTSTSTGTMTRIHGYDKYGNWVEQFDTIQTTSITTVNKTITIPNGVTGVRFSTRDSVRSIQFEFGSTATAYEPYLGQTYSITFPDAAGTVYGGTLTVNKDGTGSLVVDKESYTVPQITQDMLITSTTAGSTGLFVKVPTTGTISGITDDNAYYAKCSVADARTNATRGGAWTVNAGGEGYTNVWVPSDSTLADLNEKLQGQQIVNTLKTAISYTIPAPVIRSLLGANNVWADTGNVLRLDYTADTKSYIDNLFASLTNATGQAF